MRIESLHLTRKKKLNWPGFGAVSGPWQTGHDRLGVLTASSAPHARSKAAQRSPESAIDGRRQLRGMLCIDMPDKSRQRYPKAVGQTEAPKPFSCNEKQISFSFGRM